MPAMFLDEARAGPADRIEPDILTNACHRARNAGHYDGGKSTV